MLKKSVGGDLGITATVPSGATVLWDKTAADLQSGVAISNDVITGTSKHIADWSSQGFEPEKGTNFVSIHLKAATGATLQCECIPSQGSPTPSFTDDDVVLQITPDTTGVLVKSTKDGITKSASFDISMTLEEE